MVAFVDVIIPWFEAMATPERYEALAYVHGAWQNKLGVSPTVSVCLSERFCKAEAVMPAVEASRASVVVVADADVVPTVDVPTAVADVWSGRELWARPYTEVFRLNAGPTYEYMMGNPVDLENIFNLTQKPYIGVPGGGIVVISRHNYLKIPLDKRFKGWGGEDESWGLALWTLLGAPWIGMSNLIHLYHEPQERLTRQIGNEANELLRHRYHACISKPDRMQALVNESKV